MRLRESIATPDRFDETIFKTKCKDSTKPHYPQLLASQVIPFDHSKQDAAFPSLPLISHSRSSEDTLLEKCCDDTPSADLDKTYLTICASEQPSDHIKSDATGSPEEEVIESIEIANALPEECSTCNKQTIEWHSLTLACQVHIFAFFLRSQKYTEVVAATLKLSHQELETIKSHMNLRKIHKVSLESIWAYGVARGGLGPGIIRPDDMDEIMDYLLFASRYELTDEADIVRGQQFLRELGFTSHAIFLFENYEEQHQRHETKSTLPHQTVQRKRRRKSLNHELRVKAIQANLSSKEKPAVKSAPASTLQFTNLCGSGYLPSHQKIEKSKPNRIRLSIDEDGLATITHDSAASEPLKRTESLPISMSKTPTMLPIPTTKRSLSSNHTHLPEDNGDNKIARTKLPVLGCFKPSSSVSSRKSSQASMVRAIPEVRQSKGGEQGLSGTQNSALVTTPIDITHSSRARGLEAFEQQQDRSKSGPETPNNQATHLPSGDTTIDCLGDTASSHRQLLEVVNHKPSHRNTFRNAFDPEDNLDVQGLTPTSVGDEASGTSVAGRTTIYNQIEQAHESAPCYSPISEQEPESLPLWARPKIKSPQREPLCHPQSLGHTPQLAFQRRAPTSISRNTFLQSILDESSTSPHELLRANETIGDLPGWSGGELFNLSLESITPITSGERSEYDTTQTDFSISGIDKRFATLVTPSTNGSIGVHACKHNKAVFSPKVHYPIASTIELNTSVSPQLDAEQINEGGSPGNVQEKGHYFVSLETLQNSPIPQEYDDPSHIRDNPNGAVSRESSEDPLTNPNSTRPKPTTKSLQSTTKPKSAPQPKPKSKSTGKAPSSPPSKHTRTASANAKPRTRSAGLLSSTASLYTNANGSTKKRRSDYGSKRKPYKKRGSVAVVSAQGEPSVDADGE